MAIRVFLADDHTIVRDGLSSLLMSADNITVVGDAADGAKAVHEVERLHPDVVVMDIAMPQLNGIEATQRICGADPATRVLILSVHATLDHVFLALKAGAKGYLLKGSAAREVVEAIRVVYDGHYYLSREITTLMIQDYLQQRQNASPEFQLSNLTSRERVILQMVAEGKTSKAIAETVGLASTSVDIYRSRLMKKLGIKDLSGLVRFAIQHGLTPLE
jgi:DNA-binding NarL/FixJ family response regulator